MPESAVPEAAWSARLKRIVNPPQAQNRQQMLLTLASSLFAIVLALAVGSLILAVSGKDWAALFEKMGDNLADSEKLINALREATPLMISAVAVAIGFKMNMFNIGVEGQWLMGAFFGAVVGAQFSLPAPLHIAVIFLVAAAAGAAWASIAGVLKVTRGVNEVIATIMLNALVNNLLQFLFDEYFRFTKPGGTLDVKTKPIPSTGWLPDIVHGRLSSAFILALVMVFGYWLLVFKSRFGFRLRASGGNATAAATGGINSKKLIIISMARCGADAGLGGRDDILAHPSHAGVPATRRATASTASRWPCWAATTHSASSSRPCCSASSTRSSGRCSWRSCPRRSSRSSRP